ncbi:MAG: hypothetical protein ABI780_04310 [Ardenticatenales bacterium]
MDDMTETSLDRLNQLAQSGEQAAADITTLHSAVVSLRAQVETLTAQLSGLREVQAESATLLGQVHHRLAALDRLSAAEERITAVQAAGERTAERVEAVAADLARVARIEDGVGQIRVEMVDQLRQIEDRGHIERAAQDKRHDALASETAVALAQLRQSAMTVDQANERFTAQERARQELFDGIGRLTARVEALGGERSTLEDITRRADIAASARIDGLAKQIEAQLETIAAWQKRIEQQERIIGEARQIAADVERAAEAMPVAQRSAVEAARVFEARVESSLDTFREEATEEWRQHLALHDAARAQAERDRVQRSGERQAALDAAFHDIDERLTALQAVIDAGLAERAEETMALYQQLAESFAVIRDSFVTAARVFEAPLPADAQPAMLAERRTALRRAMRARREGAGDER